MTNHKLAYIEHISQLLIYKLKKAYRLIRNEQHGPERIQSHLREFLKTYTQWLAEKELDHEQ
jgi:hypothetical protein